MEEDKGAGAEKAAMEDNTFETLERDFQEVGLHHACCYKSFTTDHRVFT